MCTGSQSPLQPSTQALSWIAVTVMGPGPRASNAERALDGSWGGGDLLWESKLLQISCELNPENYLPCTLCKVQKCQQLRWPELPGLLSSAKPSRSSPSYALKQAAVTHFTSGSEEEGQEVPWEETGFDKPGRFAPRYPGTELSGASGHTENTAEAVPVSSQCCWARTDQGKPTDLLQSYG